MTGPPLVDDPDERETAVQVLRGDAYPVHPWRNGRGWVRHIADGEGWQLTLADISASGPFSDFVGHLRLFAMVEGAVVLEMPDGRHVHCDAESPVATFDGGAAPHCSVVSGPAKALNLIVRTDKVLPSLELRTIGRSEAVALEAVEGFLAIHLRSGAVECVRRVAGEAASEFDLEPVLAHAKDTLILHAGAGVLLRAGSGAAASVVLIGRIQPLPEAPPGPPTLPTPTHR